MLVSKLKIQSLIICTPSQLMRNEMLQHKTDLSVSILGVNTISRQAQYNDGSFVESWALPMQQVRLRALGHTAGRWPAPRAYIPLRRPDNHLPPSGSEFMPGSYSVFPIIKATLSSNFSKQLSLVHPEAAYPMFACLFSIAQALVSKKYYWCF